MGCLVLVKKYSYKKAMKLKLLYSKWYTNMYMILLIQYIMIVQHSFIFKTILGKRLLSFLLVTVHLKKAIELVSENFGNTKTR